MHCVKIEQEIMVVEIKSDFGFLKPLSVDFTGDCVKLILPLGTTKPCAPDLKFHTDLSPDINQDNKSNLANNNLEEDSLKGQTVAGSELRV
jgi:hypothetical protein